MKKRFLLLLLVIGLTSVSSADYLDDWTDDALCGWMDNPSPPSYMVEEVKKRGISCTGGIVINNLPESLDVVNNDSLDISDNMIGAGVSAVVPGYVKKEFTLETWLSEFEVKPEDLSPMIVELMQTSEVTPPACTKDFCFTTQTDYGGNGATWGNGDAILNKADLINGLYRHHPDFNHGTNLIQNYRGNEFEKQNSYHDWGGGGGKYCSKKHGCYWLRAFRGDVNEGMHNDEYLNQGLFPDGALNNFPAWNLIYDGESHSKGGLTPNRWLEENDLTAEDVVKMLEDYPTTYRFDYRKLESDIWREDEPKKCGSVGNLIGTNPSMTLCNDSVKWGKDFEGPRLDLFNHESANTMRLREGYEITTIALAPKYAEILNADQLMESLLYLDPDAFGENLTYDLEGYKNMVIQHKKICESEGQKEGVGKCTFEITNPNKVVVTEFVENIYELHPWKHPECFGPLEERGEEFAKSCTIMLYYEGPIPDPPIVPPIRPGWKILEGTDMLVINDEDPYWQTEEGLIERPPKIDPGIEYAPETVPGADPRISAPPVVDKPPSDPNPPPILDDPSVLQPVDPGIQGDVEITEAPAPAPTRRPDMFSAAVVKYATTLTDWAEMGIPADITKKYLNDPTAGGKCDHECMMNAPTDPNPPPKIDPGIEYAPETVLGADPRIPAPPVVDKPPSDPNPPPILDDPTVLQPVDPG